MHGPLNVKMSKYEKEFSRNLASDDLHNPITLISSV